MLNCMISCRLSRVTFFTYRQKYRLLVAGNFLSSVYAPFKEDAATGIASKGGGLRQHRLLISMVLSVGGGCFDENIISALRPIYEYSK